MPKTVCRRKDVHWKKRKEVRGPGSLLGGESFPVDSRISGRYSLRLLQQDFWMRRRRLPPAFSRVQSSDTAGDVSARRTHHRRTVLYFRNGKRGCNQVQIMDRLQLNNHSGGGEHHEAPSTAQDCNTYDETFAAVNRP